jgi:hypothetical protein
MEFVNTPSITQFTYNLETDFKETTGSGIKISGIRKYGIPLCVIIFKVIILLKI